MIMPNRLDWTRKLRLAVVALFVASATTCATSGSTTSEATVAHAVFPGAEWERIERPESVGWTAADLDSVRARLSKLSTTGFMAVVGGRALMEYDLTLFNGALLVIAGFAAGFAAAMRGIPGPIRPIVCSA